MAQFNVIGFYANSLVLRDSISLMAGSREYGKIQIYYSVNGGYNPYFFIKR